MKPVYFILFLTYYILGAYATTDILRLLKGSDIPIWHQNCYCPVCEHRLRLLDQLPIISYITSKGKCRYCAATIPISNLIPELLFLSGFSLLNFLTGFQWYSYLLTILVYEGIKILAIILLGPRENQFTKNLLVSLLQNLVIFTLLGFFYLICWIA